jgi:8-oxo-dGTP pyrophosphatase MutT (NUDIX family)
MIAREFSAGGAVFKRVRGRESKKVEVFWLITRSSPSKDYPKAVWRLPKGWLDDEVGGKRPGPLATGMARAGEEDLQTAALREVKEEAGIDAKIIAKIGTERFFFTTKAKTRILKFVTFYLMEWQKDLPEGPGFETSEVAWLSFDQAVIRLSYNSEKQVLKRAKILFEQSHQANLL